MNGIRIVAVLPAEVDWMATKWSEPHPAWMQIGCPFCDWERYFVFEHPGVVWEGMRRENHVRRVRDATLDRHVDTAHVRVGIDTPDVPGPRE